jgi:hypothetical protein
MLLRALRLKRAARKYARVLPRWLASAYGNKDTYTQAQVLKAVSSTGLDARFVGIAFAAYLAKPEFEALKHSLPVQVEYEAARVLFVSSVPVTATSADNFPSPPNTDTWWGGDHSNN